MFNRSTVNKITGNLEDWNGLMSTEHFQTVIALLDEFRHRFRSGEVDLMYRAERSGSLKSSV